MTMTRKGEFHFAYALQFSSAAHSQQYPLSSLVSCSLFSLLKQAVSGTMSHLPCIVSSALHQVFTCLPFVHTLVHTLLMFKLTFPSPSCQLPSVVHRQRVCAPAASRCRHAQTPVDNHTAALRRPRRCGEEGERWYVHPQAACAAVLACLLTSCLTHHAAKHLVCHELFSVYCGAVPATVIAEYDPAVVECIASDA